MKTVDFQNLAAAEQSRKNLLQHGKGNISASMGGMQKDSYWRNPSSASAKLSAKLQDRAMYKDISQQTGLPITELKNVQGLNVSTNKWIPVDEFIKSSDFAGTSTFTMNEAGTKVLNPNFTGADKLANLNANLAASTVGKIGAGFAGAPTTIGGLVGTGIQMFGGDDDPTTHTGMEAAGEWLSWGSTAAKVASMVNPILSIPAFLLAGFFGNKAAKKKAAEALEVQKEHERKYKEMVLEFRRGQRKFSEIGGTKPIEQNWWQSTYS